MYTGIEISQKLSMSHHKTLCYNDHGSIVSKIHHTIKEKSQVIIFLYMLQLDKLLNY